MSRLAELAADLRGALKASGDGKLARAVIETAATSLLAELEALGIVEGPPTLSEAEELKRFAKEAVKRYKWGELEVEFFTSTMGLVRARAYRKALAELRGDLCPTCRGEGFVFVRNEETGEPVSECGRCEGTGKLR